MNASPESPELFDYRYILSKTHHGALKILLRREKQTNRLKSSELLCPKVYEATYKTFLGPVRHNGDTGTIFEC